MADPSRPYPWGLVRHWARTYLAAWALMGLVISIVQLVLAAMLHEREDIVNLLTMLDRMPKAFKAMFGGDSLMPSNVAAIVAIGYQHPTILTMLMANAILVPTGLLTAQAERGFMDVLLARPVTRSRIYVIAAALTFASQAALTGLVFLGTAVWTRAFDYGEPIGLVGFARVAVNLGAMALAAGGLGLLVAGAVGERIRAIALLVGFFVGSFLADFSAASLSALSWLHPLTLFGNCRPNAVLQSGALPMREMAVLSAICLGSTLIGWYIWKTRDIHTA